MTMSKASVTIQSMDKENSLIVIAGPTGVGKTALAVSLAEYFGGEILSADSRQFFREMKLGTAKPSGAEMDRVPHHFVDIISVQEEYNAGKFAQEAELKIQALFRKHRVLFLVGGSGLYIKALLEGFDEMPKVPVTVRERLNEELKRDGAELLLLELAEKDPEYYEMVDRHNMQRVLRALEVIRFTKLKFSHFRGREKVKMEKPYNVIKIALEMDRTLLYDRVNTRMDHMIEAGLFEEAKELFVFRNLNALRTVGYQEIFEYLSGAYDKEEAIRLLKRNSRRYAKRQMTWFKKDDDYEWFSPEDLSLVQKYIHNSVGLKSNLIQD